MIRLTEYFMKNPRITNMVVIIIFIAGLYSALTLQREQFPSISFDLLKITVSYPGASPGDVEINVTAKIEDKLMEVENIKKLTSMSMENVSFILAQVDPDAGNPEITKRNIRDAVNRVTDLPDIITEKPLVEELTSSSIPVLEVALTGGKNELELRKYVRVLEDRLREISGVRSIKKIGYRKREVRIEADTSEMIKENISFNEIINAIRARNVRASGGTIESFVSEKNIITLAEYQTPMDVRNVIVRSNYEGYQVRLTELAEIREDFEDETLQFRSRGHPGIALIVSKQDNADIIEISKKLQNILTDFKKILPPEISLHETYDYSIFTKTMLDIVVNNGLFGFILVLIVMFLFLDARSAFWSAFGIPFSIFGALVLFNFFGINLNMISLVSLILVLGIVVDDSIVITEKIYTCKQQGMENYRASVYGVKSMLMPVSAAVITTILAFAPISFIPGIMGRFFVSIPLVVTLVLVFSLLESVLFIPSHIMHAVPPAKEPLRIRWLRPVTERYGKTLYFALRHRGYVIAGYCILFMAVMLISVSFLKFMLDEDIDQDFFAIVAEAPAGTPLEKTGLMLTEVEKLIDKNISADVIKSYTTHIGHHNVNIYSPGEGQYSNWAVINVFLKPAAIRDITSEEIVSGLKRKVDAIKKATGFTRLEVVPVAGMDIGKAVHVIYTSSSNHDRERFEKQTLDFLKTVRGVSNIESNNIPGKNELRLRLDHSKVAQMGLTASDVAMTVRTAFDGAVVTSIRRQGENIDFRVMLKNPRSYRAEGVLNLPVANRQGRLVKIKHFARLTESRGPAVITHFRGKRSVEITADINTDIITSKEVNDLLRSKLAPKAATVPGLVMKLSGQEEEAEASMGGFYFALAIVLLAVYFILVVLFNSYLQPLLIMSVIPFAVTGVFLTLIVHGRPLILISLVGLLGLIGIVINDSIVMLSHLNRKCKHEKFSFSIISDAAKDRFRPVILTTLTTFAGLLPTAYGIGGDIPSIRPMVLTIAWGLVFSTIVTLGFIPLLYSLTKGRKLRVPKN